MFWGTLSLPSSYHVLYIAFHNEEQARQEKRTAATVVAATVTDANESMKSI